MTSFFNIGIIFSILIIGTLSSELPKFIQPCNRNRSNYVECTSIMIEHAMILIGAGIGTEDYNLPEVEPASIDDINVGQSNKQTWLTQSYKNIKVYGMSYPVKLIDFSIDVDNGKIKYKHLSNRIDIIADYTLDGHIIFVPLHNTGKMNISFFNARTVATIFFNKEERNGETYIKGTKYAIDTTPAKVNVHFGNLFSGRKDFGKSMDKFISDNWQVFGSELKTILQEKIGVLLLKLFNNLLDSIPMRKIFPG